MISSSSRTIRQYCSVCKATLDMAVVETGQDHEVTWLKCPRCHGILPHMMSKDEPKQAEPVEVATAPAVTVVEPEGTTEAERASARDYDPAGSFEVGEILYHRSINRFGRVVEKNVLSGRRATIRVQFDGGEAMTLRERQ